MKAQFEQVKAGSAALTIMLADARSARNRATREARSAATDDAASARRYKQARAKEDRDRARAMNRRIRVHVAETERPRLRSGTPRKLFYRLGDHAMSSRITSGRGSVVTGTRAIHFAVTARGFASRTGRAWRNGEGERAALYIVREDALEGGEVGWWSNIAEDRVELVAFHRASEAVERHDRANANVYVSEVIALPADLTARQRRKAVRRYCRFFEKHGLAYTVAMHKPDAAGNGRNYHCHIVYSLRPTRRLAPYDWSFAASKCVDVNTPDGILTRRKLVVDAINSTLKAAGSGQRFTHLSNRARGLGRPSVKHGQKLTWLLRHIASSEARADRLLQLQAAIARLRHGLTVVQRVGAAGAIVSERLRVTHTGLEVVTTDTAARMTGLRNRVVSTLHGHALAARIGGTGDRADAVKRKLLDRLRLTVISPRISDTLDRQIETANRIAVRHDRRKTLEDAEARLAMLPVDLAPLRAIVKTRLAVPAIQIRNIPVVSFEHIATTAAQSVPPGPLPSVPATPVANPVRKAGRTRIQTRDAVATLRKELPDRTPEADIVADPMPGAIMFANAEQVAAARAMRRRLKAIAKAREPKVIAELRAQAFARLEAVAAIVTCDSAGLYQVPFHGLYDDERRALRHPDHVADTQEWLAQRHAQAHGLPDAESMPPAVKTQTTVETTQIDADLLNLGYQQMAAARRGLLGK